MSFPSSTKIFTTDLCAFEASMEQLTGFEPAMQLWKSWVLPLHYSCIWWGERRLEHLASIRLSSVADRLTCRPKTIVLPRLYLSPLFGYEALPSFNCRPTAHSVCAGQPPLRFERILRLDGRSATATLREDIRFWDIIYTLLDLAEQKTNLRRQK